MKQVVFGGLFQIMGEDHRAEEVKMQDSELQLQMQMEKGKQLFKSKSPGCFRGVASCTILQPVKMMDDGGHPPESKDKYSNTPNTTSKLQLLDLGIIQNFKIHYWKLFLRFVISTNVTASEVS